MIFEFDGGELDIDRYQLRRKGQIEPVEPQVFDLLAVLLRERRRVMSKEEILDTVWGSRFVTESALTSRVKATRRAIGDDGRTQRLIRTVHGRGYQFVGDVVEGSAATGGQTRHRTERRARPARSTWRRCREFDELQRRTTSPANAWRFVSAFADIDVVDRVRQVNTPTLILCARREPDNNFEMSRKLAGLIPGSRLVPLDSANHLLPEHDPAWRQFLAEVDAFLGASVSDRGT